MAIASHENVTMTWADRVVAHDPLVYLALRQLPYAPRYHDADYEDWLQNGRIGLMRAARLWDPTRGKWSTFALVCIKSEMVHRERDRYQKERGVQFVPLDALIPTPKGDPAPVAEVLPDPAAQGPFDAAELADLDLDAIAQTILTPTQYAVWQQRGQTQQRIADALGISQSLVSRRQKQISARWHQWWEEQGR